MYLKNVYLTIVCTLVNITGYHFMAVPSILFPYGSGNGDTVVIDVSTSFSSLTQGTIDDGLKRIQLSKTPFFDKRDYTQVQLSTNGYVTFGSIEFNSAQPKDFPVQQNGQYVSIIAPFWTDLKYSSNSKFTYQIYSLLNNEPFLKRIKSIVFKRYPEEKFEPKLALIVTWDNVNHAQKTGSFTFQLVLASDGETTHTIMLYDNLPNGVVAGVGYQEKLNIYRYEYSLETNVAEKLLGGSNANNNGVYAFRIATEVVDCTGKPNGKNPHPTDCNKFIVCANGELGTVTTCPATFCRGYDNSSCIYQNYDPQSKSCVPADQYPCNQELAIDCKGKGNRLVADKTDCKKFAYCGSNVVQRVITCPDKTVFNPTLMVCVWEQQYKCSGDGIPDSNFCDGKISGNYKDPESCDHFIQCVNGLYYKTKCQAGLYFVPFGEIGPGGYCDWPFRSTCKP